MNFLELHKNDIVALLSKISGLGVITTDVVWSTTINKVFGKYGPPFLWGIGLAALIAGDVVRFINVPANTGAIANAASVTAVDAKIQSTSAKIQAQNASDAVAQQQGA